MAVGAHGGFGRDEGMSIEASIVVTIAEVEVTDDYRVQVRMHKRRTDFSPDEAVQFADEIMRAVLEVQEADEQDFPRAHGFDVAPSCRECREGKHGACNGDALVESADAVEVVKCGCAEADHRVIGAAS